MNLHVPIACLAFVFASAIGAITAQPELALWHFNTDGETGQYYTGAGGIIDTGTLCDVTQVQYSENFVYVSCEGLPRYLTAPFPDGNPSNPTGQGHLFKIPRNPEYNTGSPTQTGLGHIGVLVNGVVIFNAADAMSYNNANVWHQNAVFFENDGFDCAKGHPAMGAYHHHQLPIRFDAALEVESDICDDFPSDALISLDPSAHSPLIGWAWDGFPIYGPFAFDGEDGSGGIVRIETSYQLRDISVRQTLADGTQLAPFQYGPEVGAMVTPAIPPGAEPVEAVLGAYMEDYEFVLNNGHLDEFNGRYAVTPEFPSGTYAYYATIDADYNSAYPYFFPFYRGEVETDNLPGPGGGVVIDELVQTYDPTVGVANAAAYEAPELAPYPQPASGVLFCAGDLPAELFDASGRLVLQASGSAWSNGVDVSSLPAGTYFLRRDSRVVPVVIAR
jgi:hypothetical protein